jgi:CubicO group peptidase (beta-lactamase class C family)
VTKSVVALLFGQAQADGHVRGPQELVALRLPQLLRMGADARVQRLRFEHLLTMTAGWPGEQTAQRDRDDDLGWIARRPFLDDPGKKFTYDNGAANLLAMALANALQQPLSAYARQRLFEPLGIHAFDWRQGAAGHDLGALGLSLTTRGMARLGELVLNEGRYDLIRAATVETEWDANYYQTSLRAWAKTDRAEYHIEGRVLALIPLRNRRTLEDGTELMTRITEGMTEYRCNGRVGYGLSEYLDQIVDGKPVGIGA